MKRRSTEIDDAINRLLDGRSSITVMGKEIDLRAELSIPRDDDLGQVLLDQPLRMASWGIIESKCKRRVDDAHDAYEEVKMDRFRQYAASLEENERAEMENCVYDETDVDPFRRRKRMTERIAGGKPKSVPRWRRNFTDDLVYGYVHNDTEVIEAKRVLRKAREQLELVKAITRALDHRMRCVSHLCARDRDLH